MSFKHTLTLDSTVEGHGRALFEVHDDPTAAGGIRATITTGFENEIFASRGPATAIDVPGLILLRDAIHDALRTRKDRWQVWGRDKGHYWMAEYHSFNPAPNATFRKIGHETKTILGREHDIAYIEPCGAIPDGMNILMSDVERLLNQGTIAPHERDDEYEEMGIGFDPMGESESAEEAANVLILDRYRV